MLMGVGTLPAVVGGERLTFRAGTTDLPVVNEAAMADPYFGSGYITVAEDAVALDVGAYIGDVTMRLAQLCPKGKVIAVEPVSGHVRMIEV